jgi:hypothetical protein
MSGRQSGYDSGSELSVFTARRSPVVDLTHAGRWTPAAASLSGDDVPLNDILDRLLSGLAATNPTR